ncbi:MAG: Tex-like N-terminal domain-containing protein, partial [Lachnospiraceae bacterium]|nr:Tex-like N-terminal domain-containing protein [Lachnospiraceae bacterium]
MEISAKIAKELEIRPDQAEAAIRLIDEGNTIPFIARYRKEVTGALNDEVLRKLDERLTYLRGLESRKESVLSAIEEQGKLTEDLKKRIEAAETLVVVEDLYRPYKQKRRTRAMMAREKGLQPLADLIKSQEFTGKLEDAASAYISSEEGKEVGSAKEALTGACDIL